MRALACGHAVVARAAPRARRSAPPDRHEAASPSSRSFPSGPMPPTRRSPAHGRCASSRGRDTRLAAAAVADGAERRRAVPAALVVTRIHRDAEARLDLESDDVCVEDRCARRRRRARRPRARRRRAARSGARARRSTCRRKSSACAAVPLASAAFGGRCAAARADYDGCAAAVAGDRRPHDPRGRFARAGQRDADRVEHGSRRAAPRRRRRRAGRDEFGKPLRRANEVDCHAPPPSRRPLRFANRRHEPLLDEHAVERRLHRRTRFGDLCDDHGGASLA